MTKILSIKPNKRKKDIFSIQLEDKSISANSILISNFDLYTGKELSSDEESKLIDAAEISILKNYCFNILSRKMYSIDEIRKKLFLKTKNHNHIEFIVSDLVRLKLLNDEEYRTLFIQTLKNKDKYSWKEITYRLYKKGIKVDQEEFQAEKISDYDYETAKILVAKKKLNKRSNDTAGVQKKKLFDYLFRKGFSTEIISRVLSKAFDSE